MQLFGTQVKERMSHLNPAAQKQATGLEVPARLLSVLVMLPQVTHWKAKSFQTDPLGQLQLKLSTAVPEAWRSLEQVVLLPLKSRIIFAL
jgi:hypothetical protein